MRISILFHPDPDLIDPTDPDRQPVTRGVFIGDEDDALVIFRERGEEFEGGARDQLFCQGVWENLTIDQFDDIIAAADALPGDDD